MDWPKLTDAQLSEFLTMYQVPIPDTRSDKIMVSDNLFKQASKVGESKFPESVTNLYIASLPSTQNLEVPQPLKVDQLAKDHPIWASLYVEYPNYQRLSEILYLAGKLTPEESGRESASVKESVSGGKSTSGRDLTSSGELTSGENLTSERTPTLERTLTSDLTLQILEPYSNKVYSLANLICGQFRHPNDIVKIFDPSPCTEIGERIARSLIRVAATRIFANPYQSILELPVNSLDAYAKKEGAEQVGKFGLGFYSTLYWLIGYPERRLSLESSSDEGHWVLQIQEDNNELMYQLNILSTNPQPPMVQITIDASGSPFPSENFMTQLEKLEYTEGAQVIVNGNQINHHKDHNRVEINLTDTQIRVTDWALGIPLSILFRSLLVPAVSEKTISQSLSKTYQVNPEASYLSVSSSPHFKILVGKIVVVDLPIKIPENLSLNSHYDVILSLSLNISLPTSRDDIVISDQNWSEINNGLNHLLRYGLHYKTLIFIQLGLRAYIDYTGSDQNKQRISKYVDSIPNLVSEYVLIPPNYNWIYTQIKPNFYIESLNYSINKLEQDLTSRIQFLDNLYFGKLVIGVPFPKDRVDKTTSGGTGRILFIDSKYAQENPNFVSELPLITINDSLIPISLTVGQEASENIVQTLSPVLEKLPPNLSNLLISVVLRALKLETYFEIINNSLVFNYYSENTYKVLLLGGPELATKFLVEQFTIFPSLETNYPYGLDRPALDFGTGGYYSQDDMKTLLTPIINHPNRDKLVNFAFDIYRSYPYKIIISLRYLKDFGDTILNPFLDSSSYNTMFYKEFLPIYDEFLALSTTPEEFFVLVVTTGRFRSKFYVDYRGNDYRKQSEQEIIDMTNQTQPKIDQLLMMVPQLVKILNDEFNPKELIRRVQDKAVGMSSFEDIMSMEEEAEPYQILNSYYVTVFNDVYTRFLSQFNINEEVAELPGQYPQIKGKYKRFKLSSLIGTLFKTPIKPNNFVNRLIQANIRGTPEIEQLQLIEVAINENTTKGFWEAVTTELIQNSVDAIRSVPLDNRIDIDLKQKVVRGKPSLIWSIQDHIGIPQEGYLGLMVPFVSTKGELVSPDGTPLTTGEIGSGFFNVYRQADEVRIVSSKNNYQVKIVDTPIRDGDGRAIDLDKKIFVNRNYKGPSGTKITLLVQFNTEDELNLELGKVTYLTRKLLKLVPQQYFIRFNNNPVQIKTLRLPKHELALAGTILKDEFNSMVLTRGIPFRTLTEYLESSQTIIPKYVYPEIQTDLVIDLQKGFTPVSNRTQINIDKEYGDEFDNWFKQTVYLTLLVKYVIYKNIQDSYIPNSTSTNIDQLYFADHLDNPHNLSEWILYSKFFRDKPLASYLNDIISYINYYSSQPEYRGVDQETGSEWVNQVVIDLLKDKDLNPIEELAIRRWFTPKTMINPEDDDRLEYEMELEKARLSGLPPPKIIIPEILTRFTSVFAQLYWEIGQSLEKDRILVGTRFSTVTNAPKVIWSLDINELGVYDRSQHIIKMNYFKYQHGELADKLTELTQGDLNTFNNNWISLQSDSQYKELAGLIYPAPTLIHELSHAWRRENHKELNVHDAIQLKIGDQQDRFSFDDAAIKVSLEIMSRGFIQQLWMRLN